MIGKAAHDPGHVLEPVPAGDLHQHRVTGSGKTLPDDGRWPGDHVDAAVAGTGGAAPSSTPSLTRMARTVSASSGWFFGENGSIDGGMIQVFSAGIHGGTYARRENTNASAAARCGRTNSHAARVTSFSHSTPMWQCHTTRAPACASGAASPAVCGSCSSTASPDLAEQFHGVRGQHPRGNDRPLPH